MSVSAWGAVRDKAQLRRPMTSGQGSRPRRPQSPTSARPSTSHLVNGRRPSQTNLSSSTPTMSKFAQAAQKAVSIVNGGCLCKHPTLGKGGDCENCKRKLPVIAGHQNTPLRSRSGSVQFGEAPPLPQANKGSSINGMAGHGSHQHNAQRPSTVDSGSRRRYTAEMVEQATTPTRHGGGCHSPERCLTSNKEDKCPAWLNLEQNHSKLEKNYQNKMDEISELKNVIDRLNSQVSYHIFSNTELQKQVDKLKSGENTASKQKIDTSESDELRKQLKAANDQNQILVHQINAKGGKSDTALKQVTESLKKAQQELVTTQKELQVARSNNAKEKSWAELEAKLRKQIEAEKEVSKKTQKELDETIKALNKLKKELAAAGSDAGEIAKLKTRLKDLEELIKKMEAERKEHGKQLSEKDKVITSVNLKVEALLKEIETLKAQNAAANANKAGEEKLRAELEKLQTENERLRMGEGTLKAKVGALEKELAEARVAGKKASEEVKRVKAAETLARDKARETLAMSDRYKKELEELRAEMARKDRDGAKADAERLAKLQEQIILLEKEKEEQTGKYAKLGEAYAKQAEEFDEESKKRRVAQDELDMYKKREKAALAELEKERKERQKVVKEVEVRVKEVTTATKRAKEAESQVEGAKKKLAISEKNEKDLEATLRKLRKEMEELSKHKDAMIEKANNALQRLKGQVLQMTCQGLLRLCVVAPRVTIAFEMKNINVAAVLPSGEIRAMLERELLPKYTKVFLQKEENRGPENEEMEKWLQELLRDMETKIEQKLVSVLNDSMPSGSVVSSSKD